MPPIRARLVRAKGRVVRALDRVVPAAATAVVHSSPDLDDSVVALLREAPADVPVTVLCRDPRAVARRADALGLPRPRAVPHQSARGWWAYLRSAVAVSTHGLHGCLPRPGRKSTVGLWHGELGKAIGAFAGEGPRHFDWVPVSSPLSRSLRSAEFVLDPALIHVVGSPRQRLLAPGPDRAAAPLPPGRHVVWVPTYRTSVTGAIRTDGDPEALRSELPLDDPRLDALLTRHDATLWFRPHPAADQALPPTGPRVRRATNADLADLGLTFYELLGRADCFVTDYSSVWVDFLLLDRPMVAFCPDLAAFRSGRGLAVEPHEAWFPGPVVTTAAALLDRLDAALADPRTGAEVREQRRAVLHTATADPVAAVWDRVRSEVGR